MTTPVEQSLAPSTHAHLADSDFDPFAAEARDEGDGLYTEITERRAQLENADILRGARAL
jgi:hypothetical protein